MCPVKTAILFVCAAVCIADYTVDPVKCTSKLANDDCLLEGGSVMHVGHLAKKKETCLQCVVQRPGVETWGCTLDEIREWCALGDGELPDIEKVPADILEEEKQNPKDFINIDAFNKKHTKEMALMHKKINTGILTFANLLAKFDTDHPNFSKTEALIMDGMINKHLSPHDALKAASTKDEDQMSKELEYIFNGKDSEWQPPAAAVAKVNAEEEGRIFRSSSYSSSKSSYGSIAKTP